MSGPVTAVGTPPVTGIVCPDDGNDVKAGDLRNAVAALLANDGYLEAGGAATAAALAALIAEVNATKYKARARVLPNGTTSPTVRPGAINVASVVAASTVLTVTFTTPMANADYQVMTSVNGISSGVVFVPVYVVYAQTANGFKVEAYGGGTAINSWETATPQEFSFVVFGAQ